MKIKQGQVVAITTGEYSDYCLRDHLLALKDFDAKAEAERFKEVGDYFAVPEYDPEGEPETWGCHDRFLAWAIREGLLEPLNDASVVDLHIGSYGELEVNYGDEA
jgi:hypothetical protein